jgi:hypothetical protein
MSATSKAILAVGLLVSAALILYPLFQTGRTAEQPGNAPAADEGPERRPAVAGTFYPSDESQLARDVKEYIGEPPAHPGATVIALVAPHAGYQFSGPTAGKAYAWLAGSKATRAVVIAVSHAGGSHPVWADDVGSYRMPWGTVPVDREALAKLRAAGLPLVRGEAAREHSLEVELPFLRQTLAEGWKLVPILVAEATSRDIAEAARAIKTILNDSTVVCVSSDFTHYGRDYGYVPFEGSDAQVKNQLEKLDGEAADLVAAKNAQGFDNFCRRTESTICGRNPISLMLNLLPEWARGQRVAYMTSGEETGTFKMSVSYVGIVFTVSGRDTDLWGTKPEGSEAMVQSGALSDSERKTLLALAKASLEAAVIGKKLDVSKFDLTDALKEKRGAFVTLTEGGELRGCIGYVKAIKPLYESVAENAVNAALHDPRFAPVGAAELRNIGIEISAMSPLEQITDISKIEVGKHGIMITKGFYSGLLLPQVATEYGWNREEFLTQTCRKAGLPSDAWKDPVTKIEIFSADVFGKKE